MRLLAALASAAALGLPGLQGGTAPWRPEWAHLQARLVAIGLPALTQEGTVLHIHQHLDLYVGGRHVPLPAGIGIDPQQRFISPIHTHDSSGVIHVESPTQRTFTLGQFWDVYGVRFTSKCVGGECGGVRVYVNGTEFLADPRSLVLRSHLEIVVAVGKPPARIPSRYAFPAGL